MIRVAFAIYRTWGYEIYKKILSSYTNNRSIDITTLVIADSYPFTNNSFASLPNTINKYIIDPTNTEQLFEIFTKDKIDIICFYSWSFIVQKKLLDSFTCLCLHPSKLPLYRGGTPIQHQIMNGEKQSAVTIFKMSEGIDAGDIYKQTSISLEGNINDVFLEMIKKGTVLTRELINDALQNKLQFTPQKNLEKFPPNKRRKPSDSEITFTLAKQKTYQYIYNLVRGLLDPYPNAYIDLPFGKILIQQVKKTTHPTGIILSEKIPKEILINRPVLSLQLSDGYAELVEYNFIKKTT